MKKFKDEPILMRPLERQFQKYIGDLHLPVYGKVEYFNYHDCLAEFAKQVFSDTHRKEYEERAKRIEEAKEANAESKLRKIDRIKRGDANFDALSYMD